MFPIHHPPEISVSIFARGKKIMTVPILRVLRANPTPPLCTPPIFRWGFATDFGSLWIKETKWTGNFADQKKPGSSFVILILPEMKQKGE